MNTSAPWPHNKYGTTWRQAVMYYDWMDDVVVSEALDSIDPLKITVRCRPVAAIGFDGIADMVAYRLADIFPPGGIWDGDKLTLTFDPCKDTEAMVHAVNDGWLDQQVAFSIFGVAVLDLADRQTYRALRAAVEDRREQLTGRIPVIDF